jgi:type IV fimbrial biogenesis protein FimT
MQALFHHPNRRAARGVTLIEACTVLTVVSLLVGSAAPSLEKYQKRRVLGEAASEALSDLQLARSAAVGRNKSVRISYLGAGDGARCVIVHDGLSASCSCEDGGIPQCEAGVDVIKTRTYAARSPVKVRANVSSMVVAPTRGTFSPTGTVQAIQADGTGINHVVSLVGRIKSCSQGRALTGLPAC